MRKREKHLALHFDSKKILPFSVDFHNKVKKNKMTFKSCVLKKVLLISLSIVLVSCLFAKAS